MEVRRGVGAAYWGGLVAAVVVTFLVTFAVVTDLNQPSAKNDQSIINLLQTRNSQLQAQVAGLTQSSNGTSLGLNSVAIYRADSSGIVTVQGTQSGGLSNSTILGSGFVVNYSNADYVVTNYHVVAGVSGITVTFQDGDAYQATTLGSDGYSDLAVLKVSAPASEFHPLQVVSSSLLAVGQPVAAIGNPYGLSGSMTVGIVSQLGRTISESLAGNYAIANVIQFSAAINPGNSGGPLLDANGAVVGISTATVVSSQGVGFAVPSDTILTELPYLIVTGGYDMHPLMGILSVDMNYQLAQLQKTNVTYGVLIENVTDGGPAAKAGLRGGTQTATVAGVSYLIGGDIIISINGTKIVNTDALSTYLASNAVAGQTIAVQFIRNGQTMTTDLVLGTRPSAPSA